MKLGAAIVFLLLLFTLRPRACAAPVDAESSGARAKLHTILSSEEFAPPQNDWLRRKVDAFFIKALRWLERLFGKMPKTPDVSHTALDFVLFGALVLAIFFLTRRLLGGGRAVEEAPSGQRINAAESRRVWLEFAKHAADAGARDDYREAVRLAYWAGVYRLEELGVWRADRNRTHREYLRLMPQDAKGRAPLVAITQRFELAWYAGQSASADQFQEVAQQLEELGCPLPLASKA